jgi:hypothetical protein
MFPGFDHRLLQKIERLMFIAGQKESMPMQPRRKHLKYFPERLGVTFLCDAYKPQDLLLGDLGRASSSLTSMAI